VRFIRDRYGLTLGGTQRWALDHSGKKILKKYKQGFHLCKFRAWLIEHGFRHVFIPF
jgi:hypothetical protein